MMTSPSSLFSVAGKNVLVTGGSRGIGLMIVKGFLKAGANVLLTSRSEEACKEAVDSLHEYNSKTNIGICRYVTSNVSSREGCEKLAEQVAELFERKSGRANWGFDKVLDLVRSLHHFSMHAMETLHEAQNFSSNKAHFHWLCYLECQGHVLFDKSLYSIIGKVRHN